MPLLVAFLRAVNVGGRVVKNETLVRCFAGAGFRDARCFRASGNVVFTPDGTRTDQIRKALEPALERDLGYPVPVMLRPMASLGSLLGLAPFKRPPDAGESRLVTFLSSPVAPFPIPLPFRIQGSTAVLVSATKSEVFSTSRGGGDSALPNPLLESRLGVKATTRNINVVRDIVERFGAP